MGINTVYYILIAAKSGEAHKAEGKLVLYENRDDATAEAVKLRADNPDQHYLIEGPHTTDRLDWKARERARLADGTHTSLIPQLLRYCAPDHFPHVAKGDPKALAYTKNEADGIRDIQKRMDVVAYLKIYASHLTEGTMVELQRMHHIQVSESELKLATTPEDIVKVYTNHTGNGGVGASCMRHRTEDYSGSEHPVYPYGDSDLAVAYVVDERGRTAARAMVWPEKRVYSRMYGGDRHIPLLQRLMLSAGYLPSKNYYGRVTNASPHSLVGARIKAIPDENERGRFIMPYIDEGTYGIMDAEKEWITIIEGNAPSGSRVISIKDTCGVARVAGPRCPCCNSNQYSDTLEQAFLTWPASDEFRSTHCRSCLSSYTFICEGSGLRFNRNRVSRVTVGGRLYARQWAEANMPMCSVCSDFSSTELLPVRLNLVADTPPKKVCANCAASSTFWCNDANELVSDVLRVRALDTGSRKKVVFGDTTKLIDRGFSILSPTAGKHPDWSALHTDAEAEAAGGDPEMFCLVQIETGAPWTGSSVLVHRFSSVVEALHRGVTGYKVARWTEEISTRVPRHGDWVRLSGAEQFPEAAGHVGQITDTDGSQGYPFTVTLVDGRSAYCNTSHLTKVPPGEAVAYTLHKSEPLQVGETAMFNYRASPRFGQRGVVEEVMEEDGLTLYRVRFPDGCYRRGVEARVQRVTPLADPHPDMLTVVPPVVIDYATRPRKWAVGDRVRMLPECVSVHISPEEIGKIGVVESLRPSEGTPSTVRMEETQTLWAVRPECYEFVETSQDDVVAAE